MGADLYIKDIVNRAEAKYGTLFSEAAKVRNEANQEVAAREQVVKAYETTAGVPGWEKPLADAKVNLANARAKLDAAQAKVSSYYDRMYPSAGYFRDSYNGSSVLARLGLSWWTDIPGGKLTAEQLRTTLELVKSRKLAPCTEAELRAAHVAIDNDQNSVEAWQNYYINKKRRLVAFLERAILYADVGEGVRFSL
jgi:hypothetical protein